MSTKAETELTRAIIDMLTGLGIVVWRQQCGSVRVKRGYMHLAPEGTPDICGHMPDGRALFLEVKMPKEKPTAEQEAFLSRAARAGCLVGVVRSVEDAVRVVGRSV